MGQEMRKSELYNLLNKITLKFIDKESPTVREIRRLEKLTNEDLLIMGDEEMEKLKHFSLFSGIESFKKALTNLGIDNELIGYSEFDKYASVALAAIHGVSEDLNYGDITKIDETKVPNCDLITYGFPCQDISVAGLGKGIVEGETRSGLLHDALRIIKYKMPSYAIAENVKNLVGKKFKEDFDALLEELESYGYNNYWKVLNSKDYGIPQNRERVFVVSIRQDIDNGKFEFPKPYDSGLRLKDLLEDEVEDKYYIENERTENLLKNLKEISNIDTEPNRLGGLYDKDGKKRQAGAVWDKESIGPTLDTMQGGHREPLIVASRGRNPNNPSDRTVGSPTEQRLEPNSQRIANTLTTVQKDNLVLEPKVAVREGTKLGYAIATVGDSINLEQPNSKTRRGRVGKEVANTLNTGCNQATLENDYRIRKLTPKECWRLMGFADEDYFKARQALEDRVYNGRDRSNSQMYKMAGNSIVVDVLEGILDNLIN